MKLKELAKKGQIGNLQAIVITLVTVGIILGIGLLVLQEFRDNIENGSDAEAGVNDTIDAINEIPGWLDIIVIMSIVGIVLAIVFAVLPGARGGMGAAGPI